jgi:hypothetical protein
MKKFLIKKSFVIESVNSLRGHTIHPHFAAYLCLKRTSCRDGRIKDLSPDFKEFFSTFLSVPNAPKDKPYLRIFLDSPPSIHNIWLNKNLAGSFAPSSIRKALLEVFDIKKVGTKARYTFKPKHWEATRKQLLTDSKIPIIQLSAFLFRSFHILENSPTSDSLIKIFREEFGYQKNHSADEEFKYLYELGKSDFDPSNIFEESA